MTKFSDFHIIPWETSVSSSVENETTFSEKKRAENGFSGAVESLRRFTESEMAEEFSRAHRCEG